MDGEIKCLQLPKLVQIWHIIDCIVIFYISSSASVVTYSQLKTMLADHDIQLFDVRNPDEYQAGHIPDAVNIPCKCKYINKCKKSVFLLFFFNWPIVSVHLVGSLEESLKLSPEQFQQKFQVEAPEKDDDDLVFHCQRGNRSVKALDIARQLGFSR